MSATIDVTPLEKFFGKITIIDVPGATFQIEDQAPRGTMIEDTVRMLQKKRNVLVFLPGKREIESFIFDLRDTGVQAEIIPLHADMTSADQTLALGSYLQPKCVVSTNVAQTSITIPDIDVVVDSGMERRSEIIGKVKGLSLRPISLADRTQRRGRAGRTKRGIYLDYCPSPEADREDRCPPEIDHTPLESVALHLLAVNIDPEKHGFVHQPKPERLNQAMQSLTILGCLDHRKKLTPLGHQVVRLPVEPRYACMLLCANERGVIMEMITLVSLMEHSDLIDHLNPVWKKFCKDEEESDALAMLATYEQAITMTPEEQKVWGINPRVLTQIQTERQRLAAAMKGFVTNWRSSGERDDLIFCLVSGLLDCIYKKSVVNGYRDSRGNIRTLSQVSVISNARLLVGLPWNFSQAGKYGPSTLRLIQMATAVSPALLRSMMPEGARYNQETRRFYLGDMPIDGSILAQS